MTDNIKLLQANLNKLLHENKLLKEKVSILEKLNEVKIEDVAEAKTDVNIKTKDDKEIQ